MKLYRLCLVLASVVGAAYAASADSTPSTAPILRIETTMHTAGIGQIATDAAGRYLATAAEDKTVRIWDVASGAPLSVLRPPIANTSEGQLSAVAMSPNGDLLAFAGLTGATWDAKYCIYVADRRTGQMIRRLSGLPRIIHLTWSPDGKYLGAACIRDGIRLYKTADWSQIGLDSDYTDQCFGISFGHTPDNRPLVASTSSDGFVRVYSIADAGLTMISKRQAPGSKEIRVCAFSPDGTRLAIGYGDVVRVDVLQTSDLAPICSPDVQGLLGSWVVTVAWSRDGRILYGGGNARIKADSNERVVRAWTNAGAGPYQDVEVGTNTVMDIAALPSGGFVAGTFEPDIAIVGQNGKIQTALPSPISDYRGLGLRFRVSADGSKVSFGYKQNDLTTAVFDTKAASISVGQQYTDLIAPVVKAPGLTLAGWHNLPRPTLNGVAIQMVQNDVSRAVAIAPDHASFLLGTEWRLRCIAADGTIRWAKPSPGTTWALNVSGDGRLGVAAFGDGSIHWYRMTDGAEMLTFFPHADRKRWVAWSPSGYYECSPGGEDLIGWHVNRNKDQMADFFPASRFRTQFYKPAVVARMLDTLDETAALSSPTGGTATATDTATVSTKLPPVVTILSPSNGDTITGDTIALRYSVRTPSGEPATAIRVLVNGRPITTATRRITLVSSEGKEDQVSVPVPRADCLVSLIAENRYAASEAATVRLTWAGVSSTAGEFVVKPKLYVLSIGISKYQDESLVLQYPAKDAKDFAAAALAQKGGLYRDVEVKVLTDADATKENIEDGLDWVQHQTTAKDVAMIFLSGHGANDDNGTYFFVPQNFDRTRIKRTSLPFSDIKNTVSAIAGKALFFIDSCHAGNVMGTARTKALPDVNGVVNELASTENGVVVFTASTSNQSALEDDKWGNGAFTKALLEGIGGSADYGRNGRITVNMLDLYISERVKELTNGSQTPTTTKPPTVPDFPIAYDKPK